MNRELIIDFINYGIIACVFLVIPYNIEFFLINVNLLIFDLISLYILDKKNK